MTRPMRIPLLIAVVLALSAVPASAATPAYKDARQPVANRVSDLLSRMTLEDKVGQMTQAERAQFDKAGEPNPSDNDDLITTWRLGSILSGGGSTPPENTP
jgi:beta-glucosidase